MKISFVYLIIISCFFVNTCFSEPTCTNPNLKFTKNQFVDRKTPIKWDPQKCLMVIEAWNSNNCKKIGVTDDNGWNPKRSRPCGDGLQDVGVRSGKVTIEQIIGEKSGKTEIKIWPVFGGNMKSVFIYVEMD